MTLREEFQEKRDAAIKPRLLVTVIRLHTGALEVITNTQYLLTKIREIDWLYDDDFKLKTNQLIQIVAFILI